MWAVAIVSALLLGAASIEAMKNKEFSEKAEIFSRLVDCDYHEAYENNYTLFEPLTNIQNSQPDGFIARFPVYAIGARDAHIILTSSNTPNWEQDWAYEFLIGGWGNSRIVIRKKKNNNTLTELNVDDVLSPVRPLKILIEVANNGHINVYLNNKPEPVVSTYDPSPVQVKYVSFGSFQFSRVEFLYNCLADKSGDPEPIRSTSAPPTDDADLSKAPLDVLVAKCKWYEAWENEYKHFHKLSDIKDSQSDGYLVKLPLYVYGVRDAHILLSATDKPNWETDNVYEIVIGAQKNTVQLIRRKRGEDVMQEIKLPNLLSDKQQTKVVVQISNAGLIEVFVGDSVYKPLISVTDENPLPIKWVSFDSLESSRVLFFYECADRNIILPSVAAPEHPLLSKTGVATKEALDKQCKHARAWADKYVDFIKVASIKNAQSDEFVLQLPFYVQGIRDANVLVSSAADNKNAYEIVIGGWGNTRTLIRKNNHVLAKVKEFNILDAARPVQIILEITKSGQIRLFTEHNKSKPFLVAEDDSPITDINYISFSGYYRDLDFYYGCVE